MTSEKRAEKNATRLCAEHITKRFGDRTVIQDISIRADQGELVSLLGVSGAGKTTLFNCISGILKPDEGKIFLDGEDITGATGKVSYMLQKDLLLPHKSILDNVALPLLIRGTVGNEARRIAREHFAEFGLEGTEKLYPKQLSGGMRQRAALLRTYLFSDRVALLDEPFSALDTITRGKIHRWYLDVMEKIRLTTVFITHDINEAIMLSDRVYVMTRRPGRITDEIKTKYVPTRPTNEDNTIATPGHITDEIIIDTPRTEREGFDLTEEFLEYKRRILESLEG